jgi:glycerophosphoryl diester phosphodiesterase
LAHRALSKERVDIVAHRGGAGLSAENSMGAFRQAVALQVDAVELDVHLSADGEIIVHHDATLDRTTNGEGPLCKEPWAQLQQLRLAAAPNESMPRLADVLSLLKPTSCDLSLEMKQDPAGHAYPHFAQCILETLVTWGFTHRSFIHSFYWKELEFFRERDPALLLGANVDQDMVKKFGNIEAILDAICEMGLHEINVDHRIFHEAGLKSATARGLSTTLWTVNSDADLARWIQQPLRSMATDYPDRALALR